MTAKGNNISLEDLAGIPLGDLKRRHDAADLCSSAYANPLTPMPEGVRKVLAIAHGELLQREQTIKLLRSRLPDAEPTTA